MMNKTDFLKILNDNLTALPNDERESAVKYYEEFFDEAESDQQALDNLGDPRKIAEQILIENNINPAQTKTVSHKEFSQFNQANKRTNTNNTILMIILLIAASPIWLSIAAVAFGLYISAIAIGFSILIAVGAVAVVCTILGIINLFIFPPAGLISMGAGLIATALLILICIPLIKSCWKFSVWLVNVTVNFFRKLFVKQEVTAWDRQQNI